MIINIFGYIGWGILVLIALYLLTYLLSRVQMKAWVHEIDNILINKYSNLTNKNKEDEQEEEE